MRGVLHVIRKGNDLRVVVVAGSIRLVERFAQQNRGARADDEKRVLRPAVGAVRTHFHALLGATASDHRRVRDENPDRPVQAALLAGGRLARFAGSEFKGSAPAAERRFRGPGERRLRVGEEETDIAVPAEEAVVEPPEVLIHAVARLAAEGGPAGRPAFAALDERQVSVPLFRAQVVGVTQAAQDRPGRGPAAAAGSGRFRRKGFAALAFGRFRALIRALVNAANHTAEFARPQVDAYLEEGAKLGLDTCASVAPGHRDQGAQPVEQAERLLVALDLERLAEAADDFAQGFRLAVQNPQQVHEAAVPGQALGELAPPLGGIDILWRGLAEEDFVHRADVFVDRSRSAGRLLPMTGRAKQVGADERGAQEFVDALPDLPDDRAWFERLAEDPRGIPGQFRFLGFAAQGRRRANARQAFLGNLEARLEPADEAGEIRALRAIERVQFIDHEPVQGSRAIQPPKALVPGANQQVVQHLVVRQEDVRRAFQHAPTVFDDALGGHTRRRIGRALADEQARRDPVLQRGGSVNGLRDAPRLIGRQGVHRIDQDGLDARLARPGAASVEDGP